jgi:hypothetical protein
MDARQHMHGNRKKGLHLRAIFGFSVVFGIACRMSWAGDALVGTIGDLNAVEIYGCRLISPDVVRHALVMSEDVQIASSPSAPLDEFVTLVQRKLLAGYLDSGFANVEVTADVDPSGKHLLVRVNEGTQFTAGPVQFLGPPRADDKALLSVLTKRIPREPAPPEIDAPVGHIFLRTWKSPEPGSDAPWEIGRPARLTMEELNDCRFQVVKTLMREGYFWTKLEIEPEPRGDKTIRLNIRIIDQGPKAVLGEIKIEGLSINTPQDVLTLAGLKPGMPIDLNILQAVRKKLWDSGRFLRHDIRATWSPTTPGRMDLSLNFWEHPHVPPLSKPIDPDSPQGIMLRCAQSLKRSFEGGDSVTFGFKDGRNHFKFILQSDRGGVCRWICDAAKVESPTTIFSIPDHSPGHFLTSTQPVDLSLAASPNEISLFSTLAHRRYSVPFNEPLEVKLDFVPDPDDKAHPIFISLSGDIPPDPYAGVPAVTAECEIAPVACLDLVTPRSNAPEKAIKTELRGGVLYVSSKDSSLQVEAKSGRILRFSLNSDADFSVEPGALDREIASEEALAPTQNGYDPNYPVASFANFFVAWNSSCPVVAFKSPESARAVEHLTSRLTWQALKSFKREFLNAHSGNDFSIPLDTVSATNPLHILRTQIGFVDDLFDRSTWPWTICHEGVLYASGGSPYLQPEIMRLLSSNQTGPIGYAAISAALRPLDSEYARFSPLVAKMGLEHLSEKDFKNDFQVLFQSHSVGATTLANLLQAVAELDDADFSAISTDISPDWTDALRYVRQIAKENPGQSVVDILAESTDKWWDQSVRKIVEAELKQEAQTSP